MSESEIQAFIDQIDKEFPDKLIKLNKLKTGLTNTIIGQVMRMSNGQANPQILKTLVIKRLDLIEPDPILE